VWRDQPEHASQSPSKGSRLVVVGRLQQRSWTAENGSARSVVPVLLPDHRRETFLSTLKAGPAGGRPRTMLVVAQWR
jgi:single-stranded DNA-binding protein